VTEEVTHGQHHHHERPAVDSGHSPAPASSAGSGPSPVTHTYGSQYERYKALQAEYRVTVRVLAVVVEQLLDHFGDLKGKELHEIALADALVNDAPELVAWRDEAKRQTIIRVRR
jgi:hypothetical protein